MCFTVVFLNCLACSLCYRGSQRVLWKDWRGHKLHVKNRPGNPTVKRIWICCVQACRNSSEGKEWLFDFVWKCSAFESPTCRCMWWKRKKERFISSAFCRVTWSFIMTGPVSVFLLAVPLSRDLVVVEAVCFQIFFFFVIDWSVHLSLENCWDFASHKNCGKFIMPLKLPYIQMAIQICSINQK